jgi:hypothetical protein
VGTVEDAWLAYKTWSFDLLALVDGDHVLVESLIDIDRAGRFVCAQIVLTVCGRKA